MARFASITAGSLLALGLASLTLDARASSEASDPSQSGRAGARQPARGVTRGGGRPARSGGRSGASPARQPGTPNRAAGGPGAARGALPGAIPRATPGASSDGLSPGGLDNPFGYPPERQQLVWFSTADADGTAWISFREAKASLRFDAPRFRVFDTDNDGRLTFEEFQAFVNSEAAAGRSIREPRAIPNTSVPPRRNAEQLRAAYDTDSDGAISRLELDQILTDYARRDGTFDTAVLIGSLDVDGSGTLELDELPRVANFVMPSAVDASRRISVQPGARTVLELFGARIDRGDSHPPTIPGPVTPFSRLDLDGDGFVSLEDLERLEGRSSTTVRLSSVLSALDTDFDDRLSEGEFLAAMTPKRAAPPSSR